jgi:hypothetical protein
MKKWKMKWTIEKWKCQIEVAIGMIEEEVTEMIEEVMITDKMV